MKKKSCYFFVFIIFSVFQQLTADTIGYNSKEYDGIVAIINNDIITSQDLEERVIMTLFSVGGNVTPELKAKITKEVLREMMNEFLKWQCSKKFEPKDGWISDDIVQSTFSDIAKRNNLDSAGFSKILESKHISKNMLLKQIKINLSWIEYVKARFAKLINISESEMNRTISEIKEKRSLESYYIHRMFFPVVDPKEENSVASHVNNLMQMLSRGADFGSIAREFSKSPDSNKGGEIGWIFQGQLSFEENNALKKMSIGSHVTVRNSRGYVILFLKDKKEAGLQTFSNLKFIQIIVPFGMPNPSVDVVNELKKYAVDMKNSSNNCHDLIQKAKDSGFCGVSDITEIVLESTQPAFRTILSQIPAGGISEPIVTPNGILLICMLDRKTQSIPEPTVEEIKAQKVSERLSVFADRELRDLKKKSDITINEKYGSKAEFIQ